MLYCSFFLDDIDVAGRLMIAMSETVTKPLKAANVYFEKGSDTPLQVFYTDGMRMVIC